jgi:voltage-gated potassium channel
VRRRKINKIKYAIGIIMLIVIIGIVGYMMLEGFSFFDALYMTVITISTVGFQEVHPMDTAGKLFTLFLIVSGLGIFLYSVSIIATSIIEGELQQYFKNYRTKSGIRKMENHVIVCGLGRNGRQAVKELIAFKQPFIVIEQDKQVILKHQEDNIIFIEGDATIDEVLEKAGVKSAKALIATLPIDADNLFVTLTARALNKELKIISRASNDKSEKKLRVAGANNVVLPEKVGGAHMATLVIKPDVVEFLNRIAVQEGDETNLEEIVFSEVPQKYRDKTIDELDIRKISGANIVGFKTPEGNYIINPLPNTKLILNSKLFVLGTPEQIAKMKHILK